MRGKRTYIILIIIILVFCGVMVLVYGKDVLFKNKNDTILIVGDNTIWSFKDEKWLKITANSSINKLNWKEYNVYIDNKKIGDYFLWHSDKWYIFDDDRKAINYDGKLFAYKANNNIDVLDYEVVNIDSEDSYINSVLEENNISLDSEFSSKYKTIMDFDNDGVSEVFYVISNAFLMGSSPDRLFSIVFMVKDEKIYYIYNDVRVNNTLNVCKPFFNTFLDINKDKTYEMILSCGRYSVEGQIDMLYQYKDNEFKIVISNQ